MELGWSVSNEPISKCKFTHCTKFIEICLTQAPSSPRTLHDGAWDLPRPCLVAFLRS